MVKSIKIKIVETHGEILQMINRPIGTLVNFDWHAGYPVYPDVSLDIEQYNNQADPIWYENNWAVILANKSFIKKYIWVFPHTYSKMAIKKFDNKNGGCEVYNIRLFDGMKISYRFVIIDMDFCFNPILILIARRW